MSKYFIAQIRIKDFQEYQKYLDKADDVFRNYNGRYLVVDDTPKILEGAWNFTRIVIIRFENDTDFNSWYKSEEYQEILKYRLSGAECNTILADGIFEDN